MAGNIDDPTSPWAQTREATRQVLRHGHFQGPTPCRFLTPDEAPCATPNSSRIPPARATDAALDESGVLGTNPPPAFFQPSNSRANGAFNGPRT